MQYEMWAKGKLIHVSMDAGEMYIHYKDALKVYKPDEVKLLAGNEWDIYEVDHRWLREKVLRTSVPR